MPSWALSNAILKVLRAIRQGSQRLPLSFLSRSMAARPGRVQYSDADDPCRRQGLAQARPDEDRMGCIVNRQCLRAGELFDQQTVRTEGTAAQCHPEAHVPYSRGSVHRRGDDTAAVGTEDGGLQPSASGRQSQRRIPPLTASQICAVRSLNAVTMRVPSALNAAFDTEAVWPLSSCSMSPVSAFRTRASPVNFGGGAAPCPSGLSAILRNETSRPDS